MGEREVIIGIDLGTTNSVVAVMEGSEPKIIPNADGQRTTPSVVTYCKEGEILVGEPAKRQAATQPGRTVQSIKRFMGRRHEEVKSEERRVPYEFVDGKDGFVQIRVGDRTLSPPEISAVILRNLREAAENYLGHEVQKAVITVPAYFNDSQRQATRDAGLIAGLEVARIVNEPTAAALAYGLDRHEHEKIAVFDLGGGTFDISILEVSDGVFDVISTNGDTHLGGDDIDAVLIDYVANDFQQQHRIDLREDKLAMQRLQEACEKAKRELSLASTAQLMVPFIAADNEGAKHLQMSLTRAKFEELIDPLVERCREPVMQALDDAGLKADQIDQVVLVGGSTRIPLVQQFVRDIFGPNIHKGVNPDEVVAAGAAVQAGVLSGEVGEIVLLDVTPLSLGVETIGGIMSFVVERNTNIPIAKRRIFTTADDNQTGVEVRVFQGEREIIDHNRLLGEFYLDDIPGEPAGVPQIEVTFDIDADGILNVTAMHLGSGLEQSVRIRQTGGLSEREIDVARQDADRYASEDRARRELLEVRNDAQRLSFEIKKLFRKHGDKLSPDRKEEIQRLLVRVDSLDKVESVTETKSLIEQLKLAQEDLLDSIGDDFTESIRSIFGGAQDDGSDDDSDFDL